MDHEEVVTCTLRSVYRLGIVFLNLGLAWKCCSEFDQVMIYTAICVGKVELARSMDLYFLKAFVTTPRRL